MMALRLGLLLFVFGKKPPTWLVLGLCLFPLPALAQTATVTLSGRVTHGESGEPLANVHVFISGSMHGTATDPAGRYRLEGIAPGVHRVHTSMIGFAPASCDTLLVQPDQYTLDFALKPIVIPVGEVTVTAAAFVRREKLVRKFERLFLGETDFSAQVRLVNPEVLRFEHGWGWFSVEAFEPLIIENKALGYSLQYFLHAFRQQGGTIQYDGDPLFTPLEPQSPAQDSLWKENRIKAFRGSFQHFMRALIEDRLEEEGFSTHWIFSLESSSARHTRFPLSRKALLKDGATPSEYLLDFNRFVEVNYYKEKEEDFYPSWVGNPWQTASSYQQSWIKLTDGPAVVDRWGETLDPYAVTTYGYFAYERIAHLLPKEYRPE